jgi:Xaa-Pro aminopeptidase
MRCAMIKEIEYKKRREKLGKKLDKDSISIIFSSTYKNRSNDTEYPYRQNSDFYYLTGFKEDNSALVLLKNKRSVKTILFVEKKDPTLELWNGKRLGVKEAKKCFLVDKVFTIDKLEDKLKKYSKNKKSVYYDYKDGSCSKVKNILNGVYIHKNIKYDIGLLRMIKSESEIALIKKAINITKIAHHEIMRIEKVGLNESDLQARLEYVFKKNGAYSDAYTSIVASGNNANTLHYIQNDKKLEDSDLILIDAGCEYEYYASDITRTIPVSNKFTTNQKKIYNIVLKVQEDIIKMIKPGIKRSDLQKEAVNMLTKALLTLKVLDGNIDELINKESYKKYYPHGIGHWMGLDVHDESPYLDNNFDEIPLKEGMVLTIEPGLYFDKDDLSVPKRYRGIGIRIEDDILVTKESYINLSAKILKNIKDIEN